MSFQVFLPWPFLSLLYFLLVILIKIQPSLSSPESWQFCDRPFRCGNIEARFPFWGGERPQNCGHPKLELACDNYKTIMRIGDVKYSVLKVVKEEQAVTIARQDYLDGLCPYNRTSMDEELFDLSDEYHMLKLFYDCSIFPGEFTCLKVDAITQEGNYTQACNMNVDFPVSKSLLSDAKWNISTLKEALEKGFEVKWKLNPCDEKCKSCGYNVSSNKAICYCSDGRRSDSLTCPSGKKFSTGARVGVGVGVGVASVAVISLGLWFFLILRRRKRIAAQNKSRDLQLQTLPSSISGTTQTNSSQSIPPYPYPKSDLDRGSNYFGAQVFSCSELAEATDNFNSSKELGDGGFGTVYHGVLRDGRVVAVKRLYNNNFKRAEQFKNEIEILSRLQHPNLVKLHGCTSRQSRELLLVYEYIPNGTVADHLHGRHSNSGLLPWPARLSIAIETAGALSYLHESDVIHRDVKTNNILLDNYFRVKVADFGLSRLFPTDVTHVSTAPQGTPGYVDPEYYQCYRLTDKSDVYSFGVVLIELISGLQAVDINRHRLDINLSKMAVNKIQNDALNELVDPFLGFEKDDAVRSMVTSVAELAFRCLQYDREIRPTMKEVLNILKEIWNEHLGPNKSEVIDICIGDDAVLLKNNSPPITPESETDKWVSMSSISTSSFQ